MLKLAVIGHPIGHSLSPKLHQAFAKQCDIQLCYDAIDCPLNHFEHTVDTFFSQGGTGLNVTAPFKSRAFQMAALSSPLAQQTQTANTLYLGDDHALCADTTDGPGFVLDITQNIHFDLTHKNILILGAGGAVQSLLPPLIAAGSNLIVIANRTLKRAQALAGLFPSIQLWLPQSHNPPVHTFDLIIEATSSPEASFDLSQIKLSQNTLAYDLKYHSQASKKFKAWANKHTHHYHDGFGMLIAQAALSFKRWTGCMPQLGRISHSCYLDE